MKTYYMKFQVIPTESNEHFSLIEGGLASCWVLGEDEQSALSQAVFFVSKDDWKVEKIEIFPAETSKEHFFGKDIGSEQYNKAQEDGMAIIYTVWARGGKKIDGTLQKNPSYEFDLSKYLQKQKQLSRKGRCLHFDGNHRCENIINAHSIQKNQSLAAIAENGHVYTPLAADISTFKKNRGRLTFERCGINRVSTFLGFCKKHDNELFEPIDNFPLFPTDQQVFLYGYRSLCRELFVKENSLNLVENQLTLLPEGNVIKELFHGTKIGTEFGLKNLREHKSIYDESLRKKEFFHIRYVLFITKQKPFIAFSGLFYPEFDFMGRHLQDFGDQQKKLDLITMSTTPLNSGWGVLFSWHESSSRICVEFMRSLATMMYEGHNLGDLLLRMAISNCENLAIGPDWWKNLPGHQRAKIESKANLMVNVLSLTKPTYLKEGLEGIAPWDFESVIDNMT